MNKFPVRLLFLSLLFLTGAWAQKEQGASEGFKPTDRWYEVYLGESKVGFAHSTMALVPRVFSK